MVPVIRVSDEVYACLEQQARGFDTPDAVLRRLLKLDTHNTSAEEPPGPKGRLLALVEAELLHPGDRLVWRQKRLGNTFYATVLKNGAMKLDNGETEKSPSGACTSLTGKSYDGWEEWRRESDDALLTHLRDKLPRG